MVSASPVIESLQKSVDHARPHSPEPLTKRKNDPVRIVFQAESIKNPMIYTFDGVGENSTVEDFMKESDIKYTAKQDPQWGAFLQQVVFPEKSVPQEISSGPGPYWMLYVDKEIAPLGMSTQQIQKGQRIDWCYGDVEPAKTRPASRQEDHSIVR